MPSILHAALRDARANCLVGLISCFAATPIFAGCNAFDSGFLKSAIEVTSKSSAEVRDEAVRVRAKQRSYTASQSTISVLPAAITANSQAYQISQNRVRAAGHATTFSVSFDVRQFLKGVKNRIAKSEVDTLRIELRQLKSNAEKEKIKAFINVNYIDYAVKNLEQKKNHLENRIEYFSIKNNLGENIERDEGRTILKLQETENKINGFKVQRDFILSQLDNLDKNKGIPVLVNFTNLVNNLEEYLVKMPRIECAPSSSFSIRLAELSLSDAKLKLENLQEQVGVQVGLFGNYNLQKNSRADSSVKNTLGVNIAYTIWRGGQEKAEIEQQESIILNYQDQLDTELKSQLNRKSHWQRTKNIYEESIHVLNKKILGVQKDIIRYRLNLSIRGGIYLQLSDLLIQEAEFTESFYALIKEYMTAYLDNAYSYDRCGVC